MFATGVVDTGSKFTAGIVDTGGKFATGINNTRETGGKICRRRLWYRWQFATGVVDTDGQPWAANIPNGILRGLGETDSWKKPEAKNLVTLSL